MKLLTPLQIAEAYPVSKSLVYALVKRGRLPALRVGVGGKGKILVDEAAWLEFLRACKPAAPPGDAPYKYL